MKRTICSIAALLILYLSVACASEASSTVQSDSSRRISIDIASDSGEHSLSATLMDNSSSKAFYEALEREPITVEMHDYGNFEKVGSLGASFPRNDTEITTEPGDIILYQGNQITIYYDENTWSFTLLGRVDSVTASELRSILGKGNVTAVFSVLEL